MINVSPEFKELMQSRTDFRCNAVVTLANGEVLELDERAFTLSNNSVTDAAQTRSFPLGVALSRSIKLELLNDKEQYKQYDFFGAKIRLYFVFPLSETAEKIELGCFTVLEPETYGDTVIIKAQDDMYKADVPYRTTLAFPVTLSVLFRDLCDNCGLSYNTASFANDTYIVPTAPSADLTSRQVLGYIAMIASGNARINREGDVEILSYSLDEIAMHELKSWKDLKVDTSDILITGVQTTVEAENSDEEDAVYTFGDEGYILSIKNPLMNGQENETLPLIASGIVGHPFRKFSGSHIANPLVEFMDTVTVTDRRGNTYFSVVTDVTFVFFGLTSIANNATSALRNKSLYVTPETKAIIAAKKLVEAEKTARELAIEALDKKIASSGGFYSTDVQQPDGSVIRYLHNTPTLEGSANIIKITAEAIGFSTDGGKTYPFGLEVNGDVVARILSAEGVNADWITTGAFVIKDAEGNIMFSADADTGEIIISSVSEVRDRVDQKYIEALDESGAMIDNALANYVDRDSYDQDKEAQNTELSNIANNTQSSIATLGDQIAEVDINFQDKFVEVYKYISFEGGVLTLGSSENAITLTIENDNIVFRRNGVEFGSWDGENFYTGNIVVRINERAQFGNFAFVPRSDGSLSFLKVGE